MLVLFDLQAAEYCLKILTGFQIEQVMVWDHWMSFKGLSRNSSATCSTCNDYVLSKHFA